MFPEFPGKSFAAYLSKGWGLFNKDALFFRQVVKFFHTNDKLLHGDLKIA